LIFSTKVEKNRKTDLTNAQREQHPIFLNLIFMAQSPDSILNRMRIDDVIRCDLSYEVLNTFGHGEGKIWQNRIPKSGKRWCSPDYANRSWPVTWSTTYYPWERSNDPKYDNITLISDLTVGEVNEFVAAYRKKNGQWTALPTAMSLWLEVASDRDPVSPATIKVPLSIPPLPKEIFSCGKCHGAVSIGRVSLKPCCIESWNADTCTFSQTDTLCYSGSMPSEVKKLLEKQEEERKETELRHHSAVCSSNLNVFHGSRAAACEPNDPARMKEIEESINALLAKYR